MNAAEVQRRDELDAGELGLKVDQVRHLRANVKQFIAGRTSLFTVRRWVTGTKDMETAEARAKWIATVLEDELMGPLRKGRP
jgi:hypothetical protein